MDLLKEKGTIMQIYRKKGGECSKLKQHYSILIPKGITLSIPEEATGCEEQVFCSSTLNRKLKFQCEEVEIDEEAEKVRLWYTTPGNRTFFKVSVRLEGSYIHHLDEVTRKICSKFLGKPENMVRGTQLSDLPQKITVNKHWGMNDFLLNKNVSEEIAQLQEYSYKYDPNRPRKQDVFDYWAIDDELLKQGVIATVGNEDGVEFVRYQDLGNIPKRDKIMTAYIKPWFCEEYDIGR